MHAANVIINLGRPIAYYPSISKAIGSHTAGIFLCQMLYWHDRSHSDGWVYKTMEEITDETGLSKKEQMGARKLLTSLGLLEERYERLKHRMFYRVNLDKFDEWFSKAFDSSSGQSPPQTETPILDENDMGISRSAEREFREMPKGNLGTSPKGTSYIEHRLLTENTSSSRQRAPDKPKPKRKEEEIIHAWIAETIPEAVDMSMEPIKKWISSGASLEEDIKPVILGDYKKLKENGQELGSLKFFTKHILNTAKLRLNPTAKAERIATQQIVEASPLEEPQEIREFIYCKEGEELSWRKVCEKIKESPLIGHARFMAWIAPLEPETFKDGVITLKASGAFVRQRIDLEFGDVILTASKSLNQSVREVRIV